MHTIKYALIAFACTAMMMFLFSGCNKKDSTDNELNGTEWFVKVEGDEYDDEIWPNEIYTLVFSKGNAKLTCSTAGINISMKFTYIYSKPTVVLSQGEPVLDGEGAWIWALAAEESDMTLKELKEELASYTLVATVLGETLTFSDDMLTDDNGDGLVFTRIK